MGMLARHVTRWSRQASELHRQPVRSARPRWRPACDCLRSSDLRSQGARSLIALSPTSAPRRNGRGTFRGTAAVSVPGILCFRGAVVARSVQAERRCAGLASFRSVTSGNGAWRFDLVSASCRSAWRAPGPTSAGGISAGSSPVEQVQLARLTALRLRCGCICRLSEVRLVRRGAGVRPRSARRTLRDDPEREAR